jgi:hypothetical protein
VSRHQFLNEPAECAWLRQTVIKDIALPAPWHTFKSFVLYGNEDSPNAVDLYLSRDPLYRDDFFTLDLIDPEHSGVYSGVTNELKAKP